MEKPEIKPGTRTEYAVTLKWERREELEEYKEDGGAVYSIQYWLVLGGLDLGWGQAVISEMAEDDPAHPFHARVFTYEEHEEGFCEDFATLEEAKAFVEKTLDID